VEHNHGQHFLWSMLRFIRPKLSVSFSLCFGSLSLNIFSIYFNKNHSIWTNKSHRASHLHKAISLLLSNFWTLSFWQFIYLLSNPNGTMKLYEFTIIVGVLMLLLAQIPSFHSLRHINLVSLFLALAYSACVTAGSIYIGKTSKQH
jgi:hypothetical protein